MLQYHNLEVSKLNEKYLQLLLVFTSLYITFKLTCNNMFFRQVLLILPIFGIHLRLVSSTFIYPLIYVVIDAIVAISNRSTALLVVIIGILCDGIFSFVIFSVTSLTMPSMSMSQQLNSSYINHLGPQIWSLYCHGVLATISTSIAEIILFNYCFKKSNNFFISTILSVIITLIVHNIVTDYPMLKEDPAAWRIILGGLFINISIMTIYALIISVVLILIKRNSIKRFNISRKKLL